MSTPSAFSFIPEIASLRCFQRNDVMFSQICKECITYKTEGKARYNQENRENKSGANFDIDQSKTSY